MKRRARELVTLANGWTCPPGEPPPYYLRPDGWLVRSNLSGRRPWFVTRPEGGPLAQRAADGGDGNATRNWASAAAAMLAIDTEFPLRANPRDALLLAIEREVQNALETKPFTENASRAGAARASHYYRAALYRIGRLITLARKDRGP